MNAQKALMDYVVDEVERIKLALDADPFVSESAKAHVLNAARPLICLGMARAADMIVKAPDSKIAATNLQAIVAAIRQDVLVTMAKINEKN